MGLFVRKYTIGDLLVVDSNRSEKANNSSVELVKVFHELKQEDLLSKIRALFNGKANVVAYYVIFKLKVTSDTGHSHIVFVKTNPDFNLEDWSNNKVQVYCDCADFKYRSAYKLNQHDSLFLTDSIKVALGAALTDTPKTKTATSPLCKHAVAALNWVVSNYSSLMKTI
jgi:hypothetical protein